MYISKVLYIFKYRAKEVHIMKLLLKMRTLISNTLSIGVSNPGPMHCMWPRMAVNAAQHKITNLLKTL